MERAALEVWLRDHADDKDLLPSYYVHQGRFYDAGRVYADRARDNGTSLSLEKRIEYLSQASNMFTSAMKVPQNGWSALPQNSWDTTQNNYNEARDLLDIARIQFRLLGSIPTSNVDAAVQERLKTRLEDASALFALAAEW